jgi:hypothetical protein
VSASVRRQRVVAARAAIGRSPVCVRVRRAPVGRADLRRERNMRDRRRTEHDVNWTCGHVLAPDLPVLRVALAKRPAPPSGPASCAGGLAVSWRQVDARREAPARARRRYRSWRLHEAKSTDHASSVPLLSMCNPRCRAAPVPRPRTPRPRRRPCAGPPRRDGLREGKSRVARPRDFFWTLRK